MDQELRERFDDLDRAVEKLDSAVLRVEQVMSGMRIADADDRADVKVALAELRTSAVAMRDTALANQASALAVAEKDGAKRRDWLGIALVVLVGVICVIALGEKGPEILANIAKVFGLGL